jgi:tRNA threonylcarbamoyladenosine biosynthesis protein TsaB
VSALLAVDTSGKNGGIALARVPASSDSSPKLEVVEVVALAGGTFSAQLVPQIADLLARHNFQKSDIAAFAVVSGPGSFTGLRVGLAAIKALADVLDKPIAAISLLEAIAVSSKIKGRVMAALEAGRGDVYAGDYDVVSENATQFEERVFSREEFVEEAKAKFIVTPDSTLFELAGRSRSNVEDNSKTSEKKPEEVSIPENSKPHLDQHSELVQYPSASLIAQLGWQKLQAHQTVTALDLEANYLRRTAAELFAKPK